MIQLQRNELRNKIEMRDFKHEMEEEQRLKQDPVDNKPEATR